jgi:hypothetical protein
MKFTAEPESDNWINFLEITIRKTLTSWITSIYRKPSSTDSIIPYSSNHPPQHRHTAIRYLKTYHIRSDEYKEELETIHEIMWNNGFPFHAHKAPTPRQPTPSPDQRTDTTMQKWAPFTYVGRETTFITILFKKTDLKITMPTNNSLQKLLMPKTQTANKYTRSGAYKLTCPDCDKSYIGQTGRSFLQILKEHTKCVQN